MPDPKPRRGLNANHVMVRSTLRYLADCSTTSPTCIGSTCTGTCCRSFLNGTRVDTCPSYGNPIGSISDRAHGTGCVAAAAGASSCTERYRGASVGYTVSWGCGGTWH